MWLNRLEVPRVLSGNMREVQTDTSRVIWNEDDSKRGVNKAKAQAALRAARQGPEQTKPNQSAEILPTCSGISSTSSLSSS